MTNRQSPRNYDTGYFPTSIGANADVICALSNSRTEISDVYEIHLNFISESNSNTISRNHL